MQNAGKCASVILLFHNSIWADLLFCSGVNVQYHQPAVFIIKSEIHYAKYNTAPVSFANHNHRAGGLYTKKIPLDVISYIKGYR